ncbi:lipocalin-like domain-containing protein [Neptunomonas antarctica]|uniref:Predicted secreted hydrolase n=1 Tax=Neptunomonas antarctica TaxID=619304 RepID=A0A1N7L6H7_9GAMM|nr:lipocalin-like domain-containing protein [Neptunomonas antarctica]SIS69403.1 Predicted secreted hydrolase [Neptunomonas antarctica]
MAKLGKLFILASVFSMLGWLFFKPPFDPVINGDSPATGLFGRGLYNADSALEPGQKADPDYIITLPLDHAEHTRFDIEWWYLTANLHDQQGNNYGLQWTLFRFRSPAAKTQDDKPESSWHNNQVYMAHASVHSMKNHWFGEKFARGGVGNAGVIASPFSLFIDGWKWQNNQAGKNLLPAQLSFDVPINEPINALQMSTKNDESPVISVNLLLKQSGPYVFHGENGYSIKSGNRQHASHYYSNPFIEVSGKLIFDDDKSISGKRDVKITGEAWFDQEWTSQLLDTQTLGWDWMSLHLNDGSKLMAFRMRLKGQNDYVTGSLISPNGQLRTLSPADISLTPIQYKTVNAKELPLAWQVQIPSAGIYIEVEALKKEQWNPALVSYYEGMVGIKGTHQGRGFLELTGY